MTNIFVILLLIIFYYSIQSINYKISYLAPAQTNTKTQVNTGKTQASISTPTISTTPSPTKILSLNDINQMINNNIDINDGDVTDNNINIFSKNSKFYYDGKYHMDDYLYDDKQYMYLFE